MTTIQKPNKIIERKNQKTRFDCIFETSKSQVGNKQVRK